MENRRWPRAWLLTALLAGCAAPAPDAAKAPAPCDDPNVQDLVSTLLTLDMACDEIAPQTKAERDRIVSGVLGEYRACFARFQQLNREIREESKLAAEAIRRAAQPPESTTCSDFAARIARLRKLTGR